MIEQLGDSGEPVRYLTALDLAKEFGVPLDAIRRWVYERRLPPPIDDDLAEKLGVPPNATRRYVRKRRWPLLPSHDDDGKGLLWNEAAIKSWQFSYQPDRDLDPKKRYRTLPWSRTNIDFVIDRLLMCKALIRSDLSIREQAEQIFRLASSRYDSELPLAMTFDGKFPRRPFF